MSLVKERIMRVFKINFVCLFVCFSEWEAMKVRRVWIDRNKTAQFYGQLGQLVVQVGPLLSDLGLSGFLYLVL